jgi:hypothetical protein
VLAVAAGAGVLWFAWPGPSPPIVVASPTLPLPPSPAVPVETLVEPAATPALVWSAVGSEPPPGLEVVELTDTFENPQGFRVLRINERSAVTLRFRAPARVPEATHLRFDHLASIARGEHASWIDISVNGEPVAGRHAPVGGEEIEVTPWVRAGDNDLRIVLHRDSGTAYWLRRIEVRFTGRR